MESKPFFMIDHGSLDSPRCLCGIRFHLFGGSPKHLRETHPFLGLLEDIEGYGNVGTNVLAFAKSVMKESPVGRVGRVFDDGWDAGDRRDEMLSDVGFALA